MLAVDQGVQKSLFYLRVKVFYFIQYKYDIAFINFTGDIYHKLLLHLVADLGITFNNLS